MLKGVTDMIRTYAAVLIISMAVVWTGGCQEEQVSSGDKMARLEAAENKDLQSQLQAENKLRNDEIKNLKTQLQTETKKRDDEIKDLKTKLQTETKRKDDEIKKLSEQLKKAQAPIPAEVAKRDNEIQNLKDEAKRQDNNVKNIAEQLSLCEKARDAKMEEVQKSMGDRYISFITDLTNKDAELTAEVERLKAELAKAKGEK